MEPRPPKRAVPPSCSAGYAETLLFCLCTLPVAAACQKDRAGLTVTVTDSGGGRNGARESLPARHCFRSVSFVADLAFVGKGRSVPPISAKKADVIR